MTVPFKQSYNKLVKLQKQEDDVMVDTKVIKISLRCKLTLCLMRVPVKG